MGRSKGLPRDDEILGIHDPRLRWGAEVRAHIRLELAPHGFSHGMSHFPQNLRHQECVTRASSYGGDARLAPDEVARQYSSAIGVADLAGWQLKRLGRI